MTIAFLETTHQKSRTIAAQVRTEHKIMRWILGVIALGFLGLFVIMPLLVVFISALEKGFAA